MGGNGGKGGRRRARWARIFLQTKNSRSRDCGWMRARTWTRRRRRRRGDGGHGGPAGAGGNAGDIQVDIAGSVKRLTLTKGFQQKFFVQAKAESGRAGATGLSGSPGIGGTPGMEDAARLVARAVWLTGAGLQVSAGEPAGPDRPRPMVWAAKSKYCRIRFAFPLGRGDGVSTVQRKALQLALLIVWAAGLPASVAIFIDHVATTPTATNWVTSAYSGDRER